VKFPNEVVRGYTYVAVGNRTQQSSTVPAITSGGIVNVYDFENHLVQQGSVIVVYDGDCNRAEKIAAGVTTVHVTASVKPRRKDLSLKHKGQSVHGKGKRKLEYRSRCYRSLR
jgi:hypothetical protein